MRRTSSTSPFAHPEATTPPPPEQHPPAGLGLRTLRGFSGVLTGGLVALAVTVAVAQWLIGSVDRPGPGPGVVAGHVAAAVVAVGLQLVVDRSRGARATLAALAVLVLTAAVLWFGWYS